MQESRLFKIVYHLLNKGHATVPELTKKLEISVRTIYRDIEALSEAGIPILDCELLDEGIEPPPFWEYQDTSTQEYCKFVFLFSKEVTYRVYDEFNPDMVQRQEKGGY